MLILDTCALIELCLAKPTLSPACRRRINEKAVILSIAFAEIALKIHLGKLRMNLSAEDLHSLYSRIPSIAIIDIGCREWFDSIALPWKHKDPVDRLLVSYAQRHAIPIVTTDKKIRGFYKRVIW